MANPSLFPLQDSVVGIIGGTVVLLLGLVAFVQWIAISLRRRFAGIP